MQPGQRVRVMLPEGEFQGTIEHLEPPQELGQTIVILLDQPAPTERVQFRPWQLGERFWLE